ncbi:hypothetical protein EW146_g6189, partial [Bondarzewia mesenterica]
MMSVPPVSQADYSRILLRLQSNPSQVIRAAQDGSLLDIMAVTNNIQALPVLQTPQIVSLFCSHLEYQKAPDPTRPAAPRSPAVYAAERGLLSLQALGNFGPFFATAAPSSPLLTPILRGWPGIFRWMTIFYTLHSGKPHDEAQRRNVFEMISYALYSITNPDHIQRVVSSTPGLLRLATILWLRDDEGSPSNRRLPIPAAAAAFHHVIFDASSVKFDEVLEHSEKTSDALAHFALRRLHATLKRTPLVPDHVHTHVDVLVSLSRVATHPLRASILQKGGIGLVTRAFLLLFQHSTDPSTRDALISSTGFLRNLLECTSGIPWVLQSVHEGLLTAFARASSPALSSFDPDAHNYTLELVSDVIPRYLVYRSVIVAIYTALNKLRANNPELMSRVKRSSAKQAWANLERLAAERMAIKSEWTVFRKQIAYCDH